MNCPGCQKPVQEGFKFCPYCGTGTNVIPICANCKSETKPGWVSCPHCGTSLSHKVPQNVPIQNPYPQNPYPPNRYEHGHGQEHGHHGGSSGKHRKKGFLGGFFSS